MHRTPVSNLYQDLALAEFYDVAPRQRPDFGYCVALAANAGSVLDLGCGTGALACALAMGRHVSAVDPAAAMLALAQARTGHSFQVFQTRKAQRAVLAELIDTAGLAVDHWFGAWFGTAFTPESREIIPLGRLV